MFAGFNLKIDDYAFLGDMFYDVGKKVLREDKAIIETGVKKYICKNSYLDGSAMQEDWFPKIKANIFISHAHKDEKMVISFAGWLYEIFGLKAFVDSCVWGYANDLLKIIDDEYCVQSKDGLNTTYSYKTRNYSTSHVHMMLSMALTKMIDKTECLFFVNTPESIMVSDLINSNSTLSPWIFAELQISETIRHKKLQEYRPEQIKKMAQYEMSQLLIKYDVRVDHLTELFNNDLAYWWMHGRKAIREFPLDCLYEYKGMLAQPINE